ncbi:Uncharacterized protein FKW44_022686 [Caligus rogercresseyi]|uniref:Tc1-like transposase DDE domain-containing protein n=1 Tax=Caligus rogercresseyi TaxID=217165 RepID=A0A7T8GMT4_CALRO|nr:Uncharacterized protein FKW44_022686 [Caligus rogercresseyi]
MTLGVVASDGKSMPLHWFPNGLKIGTEQYLEVMKDGVKPWLDSTNPDGNYVWQQDSAPAHKAKKTQKWCKSKLRFLATANVAALLPRPGPLDYGI